jgi:hypothetical protein
MAHVKILGTFLEPFDLVYFRLALGYQAAGFVQARLIMPDFPFANISGGTVGDQSVEIRGTTSALEALRDSLAAALDVGVARLTLLDGRNSPYDVRIARNDQDRSKWPVPAAACAEDD